MQKASIFSDWLTLLDVRHTLPYSDRQFADMPFRSLFGLSKLLQSYGIDTRGIHIACKREISRLPVPFLACMSSGEMVLVTSAGPDTVAYLSQGQPMSAPASDFADAWSGDALLAHPRPDASEPGYTSHRFAAIMARLRDIGLWLSMAAVIVYMFVAHGLEGRWYTVLIALIDCAGLALSFMLVQKTAGVHTRIADHVCGVLQQGGCDDILATRASTFLGIFHWSEVGLAYFGVSLLTLLLFPGMLPSLALINACCLPYTVWSITYQRFVARRWCTMCVGVQASLWLLFFCYLGGGCFHGAWPPQIHFFALGAVYIAALLALNKYSGILKILHHGPDTETDGSVPRS
ncbi:MAG: hypothetical protein JFR38_07210 [Muribaculaceae bacterium]|nr:hypothetical protein [Muribaculaceae bacterium]